jgi:hypothetical protein
MKRAALQRMALDYRDSPPFARRRRPATVRVDVAGTPARCSATRATERPILSRLATNRKAPAHFGVSLKKTSDPEPIQLVQSGFEKKDLQQAA